MNSGVGLSTEELFAEAYAQLRKLKNRAVSRRGREKAMDLVTELHLTVNDISRHVGGLSFSERPLALEEEEDDRAIDERVSMADLMHEGNEDSSPLDDASEDELRQLVIDLRKSRLDYFRLFLAYFCAGARQEMDVTRKVLACVRRVSPQLLVKFGLSQADVSRKLGEVRATTSAREKRVVTKPLKASGARGVLSNGARGEETSQACAKAARGNQNRARAKARKVSASQEQRTKEPTS